jgi:dihydrofolate reductase
MSRKVTSFLFCSLDGVVEEPSDWVFDRVDDEFIGLIGNVIATQDAVLLGRVTYEYWAPHWPTAEDEPFATFINTTQKYVVSTTLRGADITWANTELISEDVAGAVTRLKEARGGDIGVHASPTLVRSLLELGILDELALMQFPSIAGTGQRLLEGVMTPHALELVDVRPLESGVQHLTYVPRNLRFLQPNG